jgi:acetyl esterase/lipase
MDPTHANIPYGSDPRQVLDFWPAPGDGPRPLVVHIHGGGWRNGDKTQEAATVTPFLERGISYAAINYRLTDTAILPAPVHDAARAIQFIRAQADSWNINKERLALTGGSAGACTSMWLLYHSDLANPDSADPVTRQSTRVTAAAVSGGQTSIDPKVIEPWLGPNVLGHQMIYRSVGADSIEQALQDYPQYADLYHEFSPINHLSAQDPPLLMSYDHNMTLPSQNPGHGIHHPFYGVKLKERADQLGVECHLLIEGVSKSERYASPQDFLVDKLLAP